MGETKHILKRSEQKKENMWSTEDIFASDEAWKAEFAAIKGEEQALAVYAGRLSESPEVLLEYLRKSEELGLRIEDLYNYTFLKNDEDTKNTVYQGLKGQMTGYLVQFQQATAFETPEIIAIPEETLQKFYEECPELRLYERYMYRVRRRKEHILSQAEESILAAAGEMAETPTQMFVNFVNADLTFPSVKDVTGEVYPLTNSTYIALMESPKAGLRRAAFENLYTTYEKYKNTEAAMLNAEVKKNIFFARARKYGSAREAALDRTEVPVSVYDNLVQAVHQNMNAMHRYTALRKKLMQLDELHMYDVYTSLVPDCDKKISFDKAKEDVLAAMQVFGPDYCAVLERSFEERWMDIYENEGKRPGAYSAGVRVHPFILLNHKDNLDSEFTLVHELGHAMHSYLSTKNQPPVYADYVIFVAEVASTCNEALLMQYLLGRTEDKKERAYLINYFLEQFRTTVYRQTMFAEFELKIHALAEAGEALTADVLKEIYYNLNREYYGDAMEEDPLIAIEWARIPHFYYNFYVYQYATGFSAAMALSRRILTEGESAVKDYLKFLSSGCSADPISLLKIAGVDMTTPEPVSQALQQFDELVTEMKALMA